MSLAPDGKTPLFHTGDLGRMSSDGYLSITGRLKEQFKLENGKYIVPTPIENAIGMSRFIQQVVLVGANRPHNIVLLVLDWAAVTTELSLDTETSQDDMLETYVNDPNVKTLIDTELSQACEYANMKKFETPVDWAIVAPFTVANDMLTPKMSVRRHMVVKAYDDLIDQMYETAAVESKTRMMDECKMEAA